MTPDFTQNSLNSSPAATGSGSHRAQAMEAVRIRSALSYIPSVDRDMWVRMGMAVKSALGDPGYEIWDEWSQQADSYNAKDARSVWKSFKTHGNVTIATLFYEASMKGWQDHMPYQHSTPAQIVDRVREAANHAAREAAEAERKHKAAAGKSEKICAVGQPATDQNPYLVRKSVKPVDSLFQIDLDAAIKVLGYPPSSKNGEPLAGQLLAYPITNGEAICGMELVDEAGRKHTIAGSQKKGGCWLAQPLPAGDGDGITFLVGEGVATVLSAMEATGNLVVAALSSTNLIAVTTALRQRYSKAIIIVLADLIGATGKLDRHAVDAAVAVGGLVAIPEFSGDRPEKWTDFNDLHLSDGLAAVRQSIERATAPAIQRNPEENRPSNQGTPEVVTEEAPIPQPLPAGLPAVAPFDPDLLPDSIRDWVMDIANRVSCPADYVAVPAMLALAVAVGRKIGVRPQQKTDWTVIVNLWGLIIGRPGMMKSPALSQATAPLKWLSERAQEVYQRARKEWLQAEKVRELQSAAGEKKARDMLAKDPRADVSHLISSEGREPEPEPLLKRYSTSNATPEALGELLRQNQQGILLERDEIMGLFRTLDREDHADHRAFMLEAWNGDGSFTFDRIGRGFNLHIPAMALSVIGSTQPGRAQEYLKDVIHGGGGDDGMVQRFSMTVWPDPTGEWKNVDTQPDPIAKKQAYDVFDRLDTLNPESVGGKWDEDLDGNPTGVPYLRLSQDAHDIFLDWRTSLEARLRSGELVPAFESHLSKFRKLVPALALVCHLADGGVGPVGATAMLRALAWAEYLESHANRIYGGVSRPEVEHGRAILRRIKRGDLPRDGFSSRDVWRPGWSGLEDAEKANLGLQYLVAMDWLIVVTSKTGGRPATVYRLNPKGVL